MIISVVDEILITEGSCFSAIGTRMILENVYSKVIQDSGILGLEINYRLRLREDEPQQENTTQRIRRKGIAGPRVRSS